MSEKSNHEASPEHEAVPVSENLDENHGIPELKYIIESLLFVSEKPVGMDQLTEILPEHESREIRAALKELGEEYEQRNGAFRLHEVAGGFQIRTRPEYSQWIKKLLKPPKSRLTRASMETLAIIAYKQPITKPEIDHIRGVDSGGIVRFLLDRKLVRITGRKDIPGKPMMYGTSSYFLELFGLKSLKDLPLTHEMGNPPTNEGVLPESRGRKETINELNEFYDSVVSKSDS